MDKIDPVAVVLALAVISTIFPSFVEGMKEIIAKWRANRHPEVE